MTEVLTLHSAWDVDRHIVLDSAEKLVLIRFSSYTSFAEEVEDHLNQESGRTASYTASRHRKRGRDDDTSANATQAASLLLNNVDEHYLQTRQMDALLQEIAPKVRKYCTIFYVDTREVTAFNELYELGHDRDPFAVMFFYRNRHIRVDVGTGNNNKVNFFAFEDIYDFLPIVDAAYKAGKQGRSITSCDKKFSTVALRR
ncbi:putative spliceosomal U5 snRNP-specific protein putative DIM-like protein [Leptomonas seymouri]|uniref:Putative spliceosomal U5 snRNP-specific protein putative DIM-like protein n=1 Tax=Leptomonas seymouri TaxID=5684 RepID=A0A0N1ILU9_LEPSE|nr:putative spliceosomal U5 snRNP-specific protein putative DIM-like protein [Leptomonas seymouri]|eukprot:KPI88371.1 putative spliceosomal U5 snRNP-specific protein putative DIM-like protein [Leptomonas seymouri]